MKSWGICMRVRTAIRKSQLTRSYAFSWSQNECEDSADVMFFAIVDEVLDEAGYVAGAFVGLEGGLDRVD